MIIPQQINIPQYLKNWDNLQSQRGCRYGKTATMALKMIEILLEKPNQHILYFGHSRDFCAQINIEIAKTISELYPKYGTLYYSTAKQITIFNNSVIKFLTFTSGWEYRTRGCSFTHIFNDTHLNIRNNEDVYLVLLPALYPSGTLIE